MQSMLHMESTLPSVPSSAPATDGSGFASATEYAAVYARTDSPMQYGDVYGVPGVSIVPSAAGLAGYEEGFYAHGVVGVNGVAM